MGWFKKSGWETRYWDNGNEMIKEQYINGEKLQELNYYSDGKKQLHMMYDPIKMSRSVTEWFGNGQLKYSRMSIKGRLEGKLETWYENGQKESERNYKEDYQNGYHRQWYENGQMKLEEIWGMVELFITIGKWNEDGSPIELDVKH